MVVFLVRAISCVCISAFEELYFTNAFVVVLMHFERSKPGFTLLSEAESNSATFSNTFKRSQLWKGRVIGTSSQKQYLYCNTQPHELTGIYSSGATCSNKTTLVYGSSYDPVGQRHQPHLQ